MRQKTVTMVILSVLLLAIANQARPEQSRHELCKSLGDSAYKLMELRQDGHSMSDLMGEVQDNSTAKMLVKAVYNKPRYRTAEHKERIAEKFSNAIYAVCINGGDDE